MPLCLSSSFPFFYFFDVGLERRENGKLLSHSSTEPRRPRGRFLSVSGGSGIEVVNWFWYIRDENYEVFK